MQERVRLVDMSERERNIAVAWLVAGEGAIMLGAANLKPYSYYAPIVNITNRDLPWLLEVQECMGGRIGNDGWKDNRQPCYTLFFERQTDVLRVLQAIYPYLPIKREQARLVMGFCERRLTGKRTHKPYVKEDHEARAAIIRLNTRGVSNPHRITSPGHQHPATDHHPPPT